MLDIFRAPDPKFMVLVGAGEAELLQHRKPEWLARDLADAIKHANCIGIPAKDTREIIIRTLHDNYYPVEEGQFIEVHPFVFVLYPELIGQLARGKRVLWITYGADKIVRNMNDQAFRDYYGLHDITNNDSIEFAEPYGHTYGAGFPKIDMQQAYEDVQQQLVRVSDFDLAFVGAGWIGKVICHHIKTQLGKTAIDIGRMMSALSGLRNRTVFHFEQHFVVWDPGGDFVPARKMSDRMPGFRGNATPSSLFESLPPVSRMLREQFPDAPEYILPDREKDVGIVLDIFRDPGAKFMVRCGDGELVLLRDRKPEWLARSLADAIRHADCLGLTQPGFPDNEDWRGKILHTLHTHFQTEVDHLATVDAFLFQIYPELIGWLAAGKRVLWITCGADKIVRNMSDPAFRDYYGLHGIIDNDSVEVAKPHGDAHGAPYPRSVSLDQSYADILQHLTRARDFDLAFVGASWVGKPVCHHIKTHLGRSAVDVGSMMSALSGLRNRSIFRRRRHFLAWDSEGDFVPEV